mmetsp:Transcript_36929/g.147368  ORF Transcript_36929/g.147368 Transcript_36929/m.147368 type:complete len:118 (-) Transcript_36929:24-377(-)
MSNLEQTQAVCREPAEVHFLQYPALAWKSESNSRHGSSKTHLKETLTLENGKGERELSRTAFSNRYGLARGSIMANQHVKDLLHAHPSRVGKGDAPHPCNEIQQERGQLQETIKVLN